MAKIVTITNPLTGQPAQVDQLDHTAQQIDDGLNIARGVSNPNLLDNWYFGNPVDQRGGRIVVPNTTYYSDNQLTTSAGTTSAYVTAYRYATGTENGVNYASFKLEDKDTAPTYYAAPENVVRGYTGAGYGIDRWKIIYNQNNAAILVTDTGLKKAGSEAIILSESIPSELSAYFAGKDITLSALLSNGNLINLKTTFPTTGESAQAAASGISIYVVSAAQSSDGYAKFSIIFSGVDVAISSVKLELGTTQTLAHQDENGNWVLNEIPDYGEQLARCQRYHFEFGPSHALIAYDGYGVNSPVVYFPVQMRTVPTIKVYSKAGTENAISYWNGSADVDFTDFYLDWNENFVVLRSNGKFTPGGIYTIGKLIAYADL